MENVNHFLQNDGRNCCHFIPNALFQVLRCPLSLFKHLALHISPEKEVAGIESGWSCRPFNIPFGLHHANWKHLAEDLHCIPCSVGCCSFLLKLESLEFSTKSLQLWFQKCAKHLEVAGWIYCYCPACQEIRSSQPKYATPHQTVTFSEHNGSWWYCEFLQLSNRDSPEYWHGHKDEN